MTTEAESHRMARQPEEAMLAELAEMVKPMAVLRQAGVDRTGAQVRRFLDSHGIAIETLPQQKHGDCIRGIVDGGHEPAPATAAPTSC